MRKDRECGEKDKEKMMRKERKKRKVV